MGQQLLPSSSYNSLKAGDIECYKIQAAGNGPAHHAVLQEGGMERLENGLVSPKAPACAPNTGECAAHFSL